MQSTDWWERHPQVDIGTYQEKQKLKDTYPASKPNARKNVDISRGSAHNVRLECGVQHAGYIDITNVKASDLP